MVSSTIVEVTKQQESDSANVGTRCSANVGATPDIEKKYVHHVYNDIAQHFSATRFAKWPKVARFLNSLSPGSVILDVGCGNGKYLGFNPNCFYIGCDISPPLINICARNGHEVLVADAVNLPYITNFGDVAISIAVLHHLSTESRRRKAIEELIRVVRKGGVVLITVWAVEQEDGSLISKWTPLSGKYNEGWVSSGCPQVRNSATQMLEQIPETNEGCRTERSKYHFTGPGDGETGRKDNMMAASFCNVVNEHAIASSNCKADINQEYFVPWHLPYHRAEVNGASTAAIANGLAKKDDRKGAVVYNRYYHIFAEGELQRRGLQDDPRVPCFYRLFPSMPPSSSPSLARDGSPVALVEKNLRVDASFGITLVADALVVDCEGSSFDLISLPEGMVGANRLRDCGVLESTVKKHVEKGGLYAAICAVPAVVLRSCGLLNGLKSWQAAHLKVVEIGVNKTDYSCSLVAGVDNAETVEEFYDKSNWCIILRKR